MSMSSVALPIWRRVARKFEEEIAAGTLLPGDKLPTEHRLAEDFSTNRHAVRRALAYLQAKGLVESTQGRGSFVRRPVILYQIGRRTRFTDVIVQQAADPRTQTLTLDVCPATPEVAAALEIRSGDPVVHLERIGFANDQPIGLSQHFFDFARFPSFAEDYQTSKSITRALADCGVPDYSRLRTRILTRLPTLQEAKLLGVAKSVPLIVTRSWNVDGQGRPLEYGEACLASDRVEIEIEAEPPAVIDHRY